MKVLSISLAVALVIILGAVVFTMEKGGDMREASRENNVHMEGATQIIEIDAKGGYVPRQSIAKAGVPTVIRFNTTATFDCSASVRIPSMDISKTLPQTGTTDIDIGTHEVGPLEGSCGMGMYPFEVVFQ